MIWEIRITSIFYCIYLAIWIGLLAAGIWRLLGWGCAIPGYWTAGILSIIGIIINFGYAIAESREVNALARATGFTYDDICIAIHYWGICPQAIVACKSEDDFTSLMKRQFRIRNYGDA